MTPAEQIRLAAEGDLKTFINLVAPHRVLGKIHEELLRWWERDEAQSHQLVLVPRDHQKSAMMAYRVAWTITRRPDVTILYISSTSNLAEKQLKMIKDILTSRIYNRYWPNMVHDEEGKREKWTNSEISVDHPVRQKEGVRDSTVFTGGLTTSLTGLHCNVAVLDDVVVQENAYTRDGRRKVRSQYSLLASIESADAQEWVVGTRYHPDDLYGNLIEMVEEEYSIDGHITREASVYEVLQYEVEDRGDGSGEYLWPRQQRGDGRWFGFSQRILAKKRAQYLDRSQFYAQYYNNPNDPGNEAIESQYFQYYDKQFLSRTNNKWHFKHTPLNIFASIDFAFSLSNKADYTAVIVIGIDPNSNIYVLDVDRFKTNKIREYYDRLLKAHIKWDFRKMRAEVTVAQEAIVEELKAIMREHGLSISIDKYRPNKYEGVKEERIQAVLQPRYENHSMWHYYGGMCEELETELRSPHPKHDDLKDALANAVAIAIPPRARAQQAALGQTLQFNSRFGGVSFR